MASLMRLHDTATGGLVDLVPAHAGSFSMYVCGPTVYDVPHVGHGRHVLVYDVLRRYLEWRGVAVRHVSNVTDIDDKIIQRAASEGRSPAEVALEHEAVWWAAMDRLGAARPTAAPRATEYVEAMIALIDALVSSGAAYPGGDGIYLEVARVAGYGLLARQPLDSLRTGAGAGGAGRAVKRSPLDFALWKEARPGEPSWPSPFGAGRPGWHTECVVMALDLLGEAFDLHAGGLDLAFPHHENERAQAVAVGRAFARHWMHHAFVETGGQKMSKSAGNFTSLTDLLARTDPRAYRLLVLRSHYRKPMEVSPASIADAEKGLRRLDALARRAGSQPSPPPIDSGHPGTWAKQAAGARDRFVAAMDDDLDTPSAMGVVFDLVRSANSALDSGHARGAGHLVGTIVELTGALGLGLHHPGAGIDAASAELVRRRDQARAASDFAAADHLRDRLVALGWVVEDGPGGTRLHPSPA